MSTPATAYVNRVYASAQATAETVKTHATVVGQVYDRLKALQGELAAIQALATGEATLTAFGIPSRLRELLAALDSLQKEIDGT